MSNSSGTNEHDENVARINAEGMKDALKAADESKDGDMDKLMQMMDQLGLGAKSTDELMAMIQQVQQPMAGLYGAGGRPAGAPTGPLM